MPPIILRPGRQSLRPQLKMDGGYLVTRPQPPRPQSRRRSRGLDPIPQSPQPQQGCGIRVAEGGTDQTSDSTLSASPTRRPQSPRPQLSTKVRCPMIGPQPPSPGETALGSRHQQGIETDPLHQYEDGRVGSGPWIISTPRVHPRPLPNHPGDATQTPARGPPENLAREWPE
jgi:hypothetical protein